MWLVYRQKQVNKGVLLIRLAGVSPTEKSDLVIHTLEKHGHELGGFFSILSPTALRIRKLEFGVKAEPAKSK